MTTKKYKNTGFYNNMRQKLKLSIASLLLLNVGVCSALDLNQTVTQPQIIGELKELINWLSWKLYPSNPTIGTAIVILIILIIIFNKPITRFIQGYTIKMRKEW